MTTDEQTWQPIETAPKDVNVLLSNGERMLLGKWGEYCKLNVPGFTHWMSLPPPPARTTEPQ